MHVAEWRAARLGASLADARSVRARPRYQRPSTQSWWHPTVTPRRHCAAPGRGGPGRLGPVRRSRTGPQDVSRLWCFIAGYLGKGDTFARALLEFSDATPSRTTATKNDRDYQAFALRFAPRNAPVHE